MPQLCTYGSQVRLTSRERLIVHKEIIPRTRSRQFARPFGFASKQVLESVSSASPHGFHQLIQKIIHAVIMGRPLRIVRFIAEFMDVVLTNRTFGDIECGCYLLKSKLTNGFMEGPIPEYELESPALDRYRELDLCSCVSEESETETECETESESEACGSFESCETLSMGSDQFNVGSIAEHDLTGNALDRYRNLEDEESPLGTDLYECQYRLQLGYDEQTHPSRRPDRASLEQLEFGDELFEQRDSVSAAVVPEMCGPDDFIEGPILEDDPTGLALDRYREHDTSVLKDMTDLDAFTHGPIPQYQLLGKALDRYRKYKMSDELHGDEDFRDGPVTQQLLMGEALDRYREVEGRDRKHVLPECGEFSGYILEARDSHDIVRTMEMLAGEDQAPSKLPDRPVGTDAADKRKQGAPTGSTDNEQNEYDFTRGPILEHDLIGAALDRYRVYRPPGLSGPDDFAEGPIPENDPTGPALDRYRKYDGAPQYPELSEFGLMLVEQNESITDSQTGPGDFTKGPIPEHRPTGAALDRYREHGEWGCKPGTNAFLLGDIKEHRLEGSALDRYRDHDTKGVMSMDKFTSGPIPEPTITIPALDRYRDILTNTTLSGPDDFLDGRIPEQILLGPALDRYRQLEDTPLTGLPESHEFEVQVAEAVEKPDESREHTDSEDDEDDDLPDCSDLGEDASGPCDSSDDHCHPHEESNDDEPA